MQIKQELNDLLVKVAESKNWNNYDIHLNLDSEKGDGFLGEFFIGHVLNKDTQQKLNLAIKKAFKGKEKRKELKMRSAYSNEIWFYTKIVPVWTKFYNEKSDKLLDLFGKCYLTVNEEPNECLIFENLKLQGFDILGREALLDDEHIRFIFHTYGKVHGLSFAHKKQYPKEYKELVSGLIDNFIYFANTESVEKLLSEMSADVLTYLNDNLKNKYKKYFEELLENYRFIINYKGQNYCIVHGDCWSNNMMFKYEGKINAIKLIDFQLCREGTPVHDLSYFFYAGSKTEFLDNWYEYLQIYHDSFSKTVTELGNDPNELLSFENLVEDWKKYSTFGLLVGIVIFKIKLLSSDDIKDITADDGQFSEFLGNAEVDSSLYGKRINDLVQHFHDNNFLPL